MYSILFSTDVTELKYAIVISFLQAFTAVPEPPEWWDESKSLAYLLRESEMDVNLVKAYYIEMALNAQKYNFIRDLYKGVPFPGKLSTETIFIRI